MRGQHLRRVDIGFASLPLNGSFNLINGLGNMAVESFAFWTQPFDDYALDIITFESSFPGGGFFAPPSILLGRISASIRIVSAANREVFAARTTNLAAGANQIHGVLDPIAQAQRTTAVLETNAGRVVAGGARGLTPAQRAMLGPGEMAARMPGAHAEVTALTHAQGAGMNPWALEATRAFCPQCAAAIEGSGGTLTGPASAVWPR
jgi:hypothetical protein